MNESRIHRTKNQKFSEYYFYLNTNVYRDFQISISVPLSSLEKYYNDTIEKLIMMIITYNEKKYCLTTFLLNKLFKIINQLKLNFLIKEKKA